jgi:hypothetical protein
MRMKKDGDLPTGDFHWGGHPPINSSPCRAYTRPARETKKPPLRSGFSAPAGGVKFLETSVKIRKVEEKDL